MVAPEARAVNWNGASAGTSLRLIVRRVVHPREIPRLRVPALRAKPKARDTPLGMTALTNGEGGVRGVDHHIHSHERMEEAKVWAYDAGEAR